MGDPGRRLPTARARVQEGEDRGLDPVPADVEASYGHLFPGLVRAGLRLTGGRERDAEELAHDALVTTWIAQREGRTAPRSLGAFVHGVLSVLARRGRWLSRALDAESENVPCTSDDVADAMLMGELMDALVECVSRLRGHQRRVVEGRMERLSGRVLAERMGLSQTTVSRSLGKASRSLERCLTGKGFGESALALVDEFGRGAAS